MEWSRIARETVQRVHATLADDVPFKERKTAIDAAYPFGPREYWPYKAWLKARKAYLRRYDPRQPKTALPFEDFPRDPATGRPLIV